MLKKCRIPPYLHSISIQILIFESENKIKRPVLACGLVTLYYYPAESVEPKYMLHGAANWKKNSQRQIRALFFSNQTICKYVLCNLDTIEIKRPASLYSPEGW